MKVRQASDKVPRQITIRERIARNNVELSSLRKAFEVDSGLHRKHAAGQIESRD